MESPLTLSLARLVAFLDKGWWLFWIFGRSGNFCRGILWQTIGRRQRQEKARKAFFASPPPFAIIGREKNHWLGLSFRGAMVYTWVCIGLWWMWGISSSRFL